MKESKQKTSKKMKPMVIDGRGDIRKFTTTQNLTATLPNMDNKILLVECYPKVDIPRILL